MIGGGNVLAKAEGAKMLPSESCFWSLWRAGSGRRGPFGMDKGMSLGVRVRWHSGKETIFRPELAKNRPVKTARINCRIGLTLSGCSITVNDEVTLEYSLILF